MGFQIIFEVYVYFTDFINGIIIFISRSLSDVSYLRLVKNCLFFVLGAIMENNKIDYKNNSKIKIALK